MSVYSSGASNPFATNGADLLANLKAYPGLSLFGTETGGSISDIREIAGATWIVSNAFYVAGVGYQQQVTTLGSAALVVLPTGVVQVAVVGAGAATPIAWTFSNISSTLLTYGIYTPQSYGALANGTHDDSTAILAASTAAGPNGLLYFPVGTYGTSIPLSPQYPGQTWLGAGRTSDDYPNSPGTIITINNLANYMNFYAKCLIDYLPGASTGHEVTVEQCDNLTVRNMTIDAQARNFTMAMYSFNGLGCMRTGENWVCDNVHFRDGHYFHCFLGGNANQIFNCEFSEGDSFQDTISGGCSYHIIHDNLWTSNCSYNAQQNGGDHNAIDNVGSLSRYRQYGLPYGPPTFSQYNGEGSPPLGVKFYNNRIFGKMLCIFESVKDLLVCDNWFGGGGQIGLQSNTRYGYSTFDNVERCTIARNVFSPASGTPNHGVDIYVFLEIAGSSNTGTQTLGGNISIIDNKFLNSTQTSILYAGETATTSYGGSIIARNTSLNPNTSGATNVVIGSAGQTSTTAQCAAINVSSWVTMLVYDNVAIDDRVTPLMNAPITLGCAATTGAGTIPVGTIRCRGNLGVGYKNGAPNMIELNGNAGAGSASSAFVVDLRDNIGWSPTYVQPWTLASATTFQNLTGRRAIVIVSGGTVTAVAVNGNSPYPGLIPAQIPFTLNPGDTFALTYTGSPVYSCQLEV